MVGKTRGRGYMHGLNTMSQFSVHTWTVTILKWLMYVLILAYDWAPSPTVGTNLEGSIFTPSSSSCGDNTQFHHSELYFPCRLLIFLMNHFDIYHSVTLVNNLAILLPVSHIVVLYLIPSFHAQKRARYEVRLVANSWSTLFW